MSGGVPKRVRISQIQSNTPSKSGRWGKPGIILCSGARSRRPMCNSIQTRAKYCAVPCTPPVPLNLLLFNTFNDASHNQGNVAPGNPTQSLDTVITVYKTPTITQADALKRDDTGNTATTIAGGTIPIEWNTPLNYAVYDDAVYQNIFSQSYSAADINLAEFNGGDTIRFIICTIRTFIVAPVATSGGASGIPPDITPPPYTQLSTTVSPGAGTSTLAIETATNANGLQFNYGIASQMPPNSELNKLQIPPTPATGFTTGTAVPNTPGVGYYYLTVDVTLSADKKTATHVIV